MYLAHYGLAEPPFRITPHTDFFFSGANRGATLEALLYAITHDEGIVKISGEVGSGKTMLCRVLMERLPDNVVIIYLANPSLSREDILFALADELGIAIPEHGRTSTVLRALQEKLVALYAENKQVVVLIDEAHAMPKETLEEIRLLSNLESNRHKLLQLVMFGQPELDETLARDDMRQLRERITHNFSLEPLVRDDIAAYLDFRMRAAGYHGPSVFTATAVKLITEASQGLTRRINILADKALLASFAAGAHQVDGAEAKAAIQDAGFSTARTRRLPAGLVGLAWAAGGALVMLAAVLLWPEKTATPPPSASVPLAAPQTVLPISSPALPPLTVAPVVQPAMEQPQQPPAAQADAAPQTINPIRAPAGKSTPILDRLLTESRPWLQSVDNRRWFVQLYTTADTRRPEQVESFLNQALAAGLPLEQLRVYRVDFGNISRYGVVYGDYAARKDAVNVIDALPPELLRHRPYPRQAIRLRPDNTQDRK